MSGTGLAVECTGEFCAVVLMVVSATLSFVSVIGEAEDGFDGDRTGELVLGDSRTTFVGVALTLKEPSGESAILAGDSEAGGLFTGDPIGAEPIAGDKVIMGSFLGESSPGKRNMRLLRRRIDLRLICFSSICTVTSTGSGDVGASNLTKGWSSATMRVALSFVASIGHRELCRFLGTHFKGFSGNVAGLVLMMLSALAGGASCLVAKIAAGGSSLEQARVSEEEEHTSCFR
jgi:hypothetical protein